jgi:hypothetical protein
MPTTAKTLQSRTLKKIYERALGREISDRTWYQILKNFRLAKIPLSETSLKMLAEFRKIFPRLPVHSPDFLIVWNASQKVTSFQVSEMCCKDFKDWLLETMPIKPPKSTTYKWFQQAQTPYKANLLYPTKKLIIVSAFAYTWLEKEKRKRSKSAIVPIK